MCCVCCVDDVFVLVMCLCLMICYVCIVFDDVFVLLCVLFLGCGDAVFVFDELLCVCCVLIMYLIFLCVCYVSFII